MSTRCRWSDSEDRTLINVLLEEKKAGNQSDNGWKKVVWTKAGTRLADEHPGVQNKKTAAKCLEHYSKLKKKYKQLQRLKDLSGFGWDNERKMVTATDAVWQPCIDANADIKWFKTHPFPLYDSMSELVDGTVATGAGAFHAGQQMNVDPIMPAILPPSGPPARSPSCPMPHTPQHARQALQEKTNISKDNLYDDELSRERSDSEQVPSKPTSRKRERASTESPELSSSGCKPTHRGKRNAEATIDVADAIRDLSRSMAPPENFVAKALELIHDDGDFSDSDDEASVLALFTIKPEIATALLQSRKQAARTALIRMMLRKENL